MEPVGGHGGPARHEHDSSDADRSADYGHAPHSSHDASHAGAAHGRPEHVHREHGTGDMRQVEDVQTDVLARIEPLDPIELPFSEAYGCVLAADLATATDIPPFSSSAMDGFAVRADDIRGSTPERPAALTISGRALVGRHSDATVGAGEAVRIATGAPIPAGADCIVPIEECTVDDERGIVHVRQQFEAGAFVRPAGQDMGEGMVLVPAGRRLGAPELGLLATAGFASAPVHPRPRVVVLSTGDELVEPGRPAGFGKVRDANSYTLFGAVREVGAIPVLGGIVRDDPDAMKEAVLSQVTRADLFISSGGVSVGELDVVKRAFFRRGEIEFYRVAMQPGMPQAFGEIEGIKYFGLPGNPVSVFVSFEVFIRPALLKMMGRRDIFRPTVEAELSSDIAGPRAKVQFARVRVWLDRGKWRAASTGPASSNLLGTVVRANGLAIIPVGTDIAREGSKVRVMLFRALEDDE